MSMDSLVLKQTSEQAPELPFYDQLIRYASRRMNGTTEAEDIVQETYANYYRSGKRLKDVHLRNSLFVTARHLIIDHFRAKQADKSAAVDPDSLDSESVQMVESSEDKNLPNPLITLANQEFVKLAFDVLKKFQCGNTDMLRLTPNQPQAGGDSRQYRSGVGNRFGSRRRTVSGQTPLERAERGEKPISGRSGLQS